MLGITPKRSAAFLGIALAGLLAAAGPAGAQLSPTTTGVKAPGTCANVPARLSIGGAEVAGFVNGCAPGWAAPVRRLGSEALALDDHGPHMLSVGAGKDRGWAGSLVGSVATPAGGEVVSDF